MIEINELRSMVNGSQFESFANSVINAPLDRLEAAEKSDAESIAMYRKARDERDALRPELSKQQALTDAAQHIAEVAQSRANQLQAKITEMEKQEPVAWYYVTNGTWDCYSREIPPEDAYDAGSLKALYALPGAQTQGEEK